MDIFLDVNILVVEHHCNYVIWVMRAILARDGPGSFNLPDKDNVTKFISKVNIDNLFLGELCSGLDFHHLPRPWRRWSRRWECLERFRMESCVLKSESIKLVNLMVTLD